MIWNPLKERPYLDDNGYFQTKLISSFKSQAEEDAFITREKQRWCYGFGNLTGRHYFHLTMGAILDSEEGLITPLWRDGDALGFDAYDECSKGIIDGNGDLQVYDLVFFKRKEYGFSTMWMASAPIYNCIMYSNSTNLLTSCDITRVEEIRQNKLYPYLETTKQLLLNPGENYIDNKGVIRFVKRGGQDKIGSKIVLVETAKDPESPTKVAAYRAIYGCVDEMLLHPRAKSVQDIVKGSLKTGTQRTRLKNYKGEYDGHHSMFVMGGSCDSVDKSAVEKAHTIIQEAKGKFTKIVFIPGWMCNKQYMENGFSQKEKALEKIYHIRQHLEQEELFDELNLETRRTPVYLSDVFDAANKLSLGNTIPFKLKESRMFIMKNESEIHIRCDLKRNGSSIERYSDPEGDYFIRKMPVSGHTYIGAVDSLPFNTENMNDKLSKLCCVIKDLTTDEDVAYFLKRDPDVEIIAPLWEKLCVLYSSKDFPRGARCLIERNRDSLIQWCKRNFKTHLLERDPANKKEYGIYTTDKLTDTMNECLLAFIRKNGLNFLEMINDFEKYADMKSDLLDAKKIVEYYHNECFKLPIVQQNRKVMIPKKHLVKDSMGRTHWEYEQEEPEW